MPYKHLTEMQEIFCIKYLQLGNATEAARLAGYAPKRAGSNAGLILKSPLVKARLEELNQAVDEAVKARTNRAIMTVSERKERLSEIARARLTDFMELGQDGSWVNIGKETPQGGAIQEIHSRTEYDEKTSKGTVYTSVKLHDPTKAIDLLNKMEKIYSDGYQDNRVIHRVVNIYVLDNETKDLISQVSERTLQIGNPNNQSIQGNPEGMGGGEETGQT